MKQKAYLVLVMLAVLCTVGWTGYSQKKNEPGATWEFTTAHNEEEANKLGAQGWDLVTVRSDIHVREGSGFSRPIYHLKRAR